MVAVVQLVEHQVVILVVAGSSPVSHPKLPSPALGIFYISTTISSERLKGQNVWDLRRVVVRDILCGIYPRPAQPLRTPRLGFHSESIPVS